MKECQDLPSDENGKFYNPANPPKTTPSTKITTTTTARTRPRSDVIDRGVIDRGVIVRPPNIVISRDDPDESYRDQNYQNVSTKGKSKTWAHTLSNNPRPRTKFLASLSDCAFFKSKSDFQVMFLYSMLKRTISKCN